MKISTYDTLIAQVKAWLNRVDITDDQYHTFTYFAGSTANQVLRVAPMEWTQVLDITPDGHVAIPPDYLELKSITTQFNSEDSVPIQRVAWDQYVLYRNAADPSETQPLYFGEQGPFWFFAPLPPVGSKATVHYFRTLPDISSTEQTNWLVQMAPLVYLFGTLHYAYMFVMDEERALYWMEKFQGEIARVQMMYDNARYTGSSLVVRERTNPGVTEYGL